MAHILLIDDEVDFADCLREELEANDHTVEYLESAAEGLDRLAASRFDVVLIDNIMQRMTGLEFLRARKERGIKIPVILMTSAPDSDTAISAMKFGAFDYAIKGDIQIFAQELQGIIDRALKLSRPPKEVHVSGLSKTVSPQARKLVGNSRPMNTVYGRIGLFAESDDPVLILGETGTGKELVANALHHFSSRKDNSFIAVNCAAIPEKLLESELFGHEKNAFTGADKLKKGMIEYADGGTLFLDEIGDMPSELQAKLLRVLQDRQVQRVGGRELISVDFRLLSATSRNLMQLIRDRKFREDLFYRLNGGKLDVPPLRERREDLPELVDFFLAQAAAKAGRPQPPISQEAMEKILAYRWPGNVRELQSTIRCAFRLCRGSVILPENVELVFDDANYPHLVEDSPTTEEAALAAIRKAVGRVWDTTHKDLWPHLRDMLERELLCIALERLDGNLSKVAEKLGMVWNTVSRRIKAYGLE